MMMSDEENALSLGVDYDPSTSVFPGRVLPKEIRVDHGAEYTSHAFNDNLTGGKNKAVMEGLPITINLAPVGTGSMKGVVERFFGEIARRVQAAANSGYGFISNTHKSKHLDTAVLSIRDLRKIIYVLIKAHNNSPIIDYPITPEIASAINVVTPNALWEFFSEKTIPGFSVETEKQRNAARFGLLKTDKTFKLSRRQISYRALLYWDLGDDEELIDRAKALGGKSESIIGMRYDPRTVNELFRADKNGIIHCYHLASKRDNMIAFHGMRWAIADSFITEQKTKRQQLLVEQNEIQLRTEAEIGSILQDAASSRLPACGDKKHRRANRKIEAEVQSAVDSRTRNKKFLDAVTVEPELIEVAFEEGSEPEKLMDLIDITDYEALSKLYGLEEE